MDQRDMRELLGDHLRDANWKRGMTKAQVMEKLQDDDALRNMIGQYATEKTYYAMNQLLEDIPDQAWQAAQGDQWRGGAPASDAADQHSGYNQSPVGRNRSDVYKQGQGAPPTPGFPSPVDIDVDTQGDSRPS